MSSFSEGQIHQLANALELSGFTAGDITKLGQSKQLPDFRGVLKGTHEIKRVENPRTVDEDGLIRLSVTGLGLSGPECLKRGTAKGIKFSKWAKDVLNSPDFTSCEAGKEYQLVILPGKFFSDEERTTKNIRIEAGRRGWSQGKDIPTEISCLVRENLTNEQINQINLDWLVTMHEPIKYSGGGPSLLYTIWYDDASWLNASYDRPDHQWGVAYGFVFVASQD